MSNEEAIKAIKANYPSGGYENLKEALDMAIEALEYTKPSGTYQCFHCGAKAVTWDCDYDFDDMGYEGSGLVNCCHCNNCGAEIEYRIPIEDEEEESDEVSEEQMQEV